MNKEENTLEPLFEVAQLAMVELNTPKIEETLEFFKVLGMTEVHRDSAGSIYLRAFEDPYKYSMKITPNEKAGLVKASWRATSEAALERRVAVLEAMTEGIGWDEGAFGRGRAYQFTTPEGQPFELFFEAEYYEVPEELKSKLFNRPQKRPLSGIPVRRLDHINLFTKNVNKESDFMMNKLGFKLREYVLKEDSQTKMASWLSVSALVHEIAFMEDALGDQTDDVRLHHVAYWYGDPQDLEYLADALTELDIQLETGPVKHGVSQAKCMYVIEPGGNRIELFGDTGYLIFDPTFKPVEWQFKNAENAIIWYGDPLPHSYFRYGTPVVADSEIKPFYL